MKRPRILVVSCLLALLSLEGLQPAQAATPQAPTAALTGQSKRLPAYQERPRLIVLTDIANEPDDEASLVRLLLYADSFDIEGLIATTSIWMRDRVHPERIEERVRAYGAVRPNLIVHSPGYSRRQEAKLPRQLETLTSAFPAGIREIGITTAANTASSIPLSFFREALKGRLPPLS